MPRSKSIPAHSRRDEWELHRRELFRLYIVEGVPVADIAKCMRQEHGFDKKPKDYEYWFKKWNLRRNLHETHLSYIYDLLSRRKQAGKLSEVVVSGTRWPESRILGRLNRHRNFRIPSERRDIITIPDFLARVQTPSPLLCGLPEWPKNLPWLIFSRSFRGIVSPDSENGLHPGPKLSAELAPLPTTMMVGPCFNTQGQEILPRMIRPYVNSSPGTPELRTLRPLHLPQRMRAVLEILAPEVHEGDHENTAQIFHTGSQVSIAMELGRLLIYLMTNNLVSELRHIIGHDVGFPDSENIMDLLRSVGFLTKSNIDWLGRSANSTNQVFLELLLAHSIMDAKSFDVLGWLVPLHFDVNHSVQSANYSYSGVTGSQNLLQTSCQAGNIDAVRFLLDLGADPYDKGEQQNISSESPLKLASRLKNHDRAIAIADLLLSKPSRASSELRRKPLEEALHGAITASNTKLITTLLSKTQYFGHNTISSECLHTAAKRGDSNTIRLLVDHYSRGGNEPITLPDDILFSVVRNDLRYSLDPDAVLDKFNYLLDLGAEIAVSRCCDAGGEDFVLEEVAGMVFERSVMFSETSDGEYKKITRRQLGEDCVLDFAKTLREHGCPPERPRSTLRVGQDPTCLQIAISRGYCRLVEYLLDWGAEVDYYHQGSRYPSGVTDICEYSIRDTIPARTPSPLITSLETQQTEIAKILLTRKPNLRLQGGEWALAVSLEDPDLIKMLFQTGSFQVDDWNDALEEAILRRSPASVTMLLSMDVCDHATIDNVTALRAALITGDHEKVYRQLAVCTYDSCALHEAVLQSHRSGNYRQIVDRLLETRPETLNDGFEVLAVASAAVHQDMYLMNVLVRSFKQGLWTAPFPDVDEENTEELLPHRISIEDALLCSKHIFNYAAELQKYHGNSTIITTLLEFNVPAKGMRLDIYDDLTADTWKQLITAGANPNAGCVVNEAVSDDMLAHVEVLCEAKVLLNTTHIIKLSYSRTAVQTAFEFGSPKMLQMLLHYGGDVNHPAGFCRGGTCLQLAAGAGNIGLVRLLLDKGATVNAKRSLISGRTAIEIAAQAGRLDVLKLLLLQKEHLFQTAAERYQFIRAAKFAEVEGRVAIATMLRQHINWDSNDQRLFDDIRRISHYFDHICLDEMTQEPLDDEKQDPDFWEHLCKGSRNAGFEHVYDIVGIEQWIGERREEVSNDRTTSGLDCSPEEDDLPLVHAILTDQRSKTAHEVKLAADKPRSQTDRQPDLDQHGEPMLPYVSHDTLIDLADLPSNLMCEQSAMEWPAWGFGSESREQSQALAPQAVRQGGNLPEWLDMEDYGIDGMVQEAAYDLAAQNTTWDALDHRDAVQNVSWTPGTVLGEVLEEAPTIYDEGDVVVDHSKDGEVGAAEDSHVQGFDWGFWHDEQSGHLEYY